MTSRSVSIGSANSPYQLSDTSTGGNGLYETVNGFQRLRWNDYSRTTWKAVRQKGVEKRFGTIWFNSTCFKTGALSANDTLSLQSRLLESVKGHQFNLAVNAAQGKQTVDMVVNAVSSVGGAIRDLKRGKFESAARRFGVNPRPSRLNEKDVSGRWLELQYGWLPMLSDVSEAAKAYESLTSGPRTSRVTQSLTRSKSVDSACSSAWTCKGQLKETLRIVYEMTESISAPRSLGLLDPASVAWELIPYSFVVDWFVPIGTYLENLNTIPQLQGRFMTITTRRFQGSALTGPSYQWIEIPTEHVSYFNMSRVVSSSLSVPKPEFNSLDNAMSPKRIWNAIALVVQRL